ncbi:ABC transporter transmembrane domain-containing protein [Actinocorallia populi]|uniref:ABC transporter transmembrane domain-containing protein n=1 Tax=Actinocorallia populi TaxID=2079200 RepID=UPI000D08FF4B|nr:ABC transporter ATP-binding protein [Actinocorallia populi]
MRPLPVSDPGTPDCRGPWRFLGWTVRAQSRLLVPAAALNVLAMVCQALMPAAIGRAIDLGLIGRDGSELLRWSLILLLLGLVQAAVGTPQHRMAVAVWLDAAYRVVQLVTRQSVRLGATLSRRLSAGEVVAVGVADVSKIANATEILIRAAGSAVAVVTATAVLLAATPRLGLVVLLGVPLIMVLSAPLMRPVHRRRTRQRELESELTDQAADLVSGLRVLRGLGGEKPFGRGFNARSQRLRRAGAHTASAEATLKGAGALLPGLLVVAVTWLGARQLAAGAIGPGELVAAYGYTAFLVGPLWTLADTAEAVIKGHVAAARTVRVLSLDPEQPGTGTREPDGPQAAVLADPGSGLRVLPGLLTAVVAGGQASALADRLGGYTDEDVRYGGVPLAELAGLRRRILVARNEDRLFTGPLAAELSPGGAGLEQAVRTACAEDIVETTGLDGYVAEGGREFSGGQQQRLKLARALAADPEVLVLVEPTSAVDAHTEARIAERLGAHRAGRTTVVFTASPLVLDRADRVVWICDGMVAAEGRHRELLDREPAYRAAVTRTGLVTEPKE